MSSVRISDHFGFLNLDEEKNRVLAGLHQALGLLEEAWRLEDVVFNERSREFGNRLEDLRELPSLCKSYPEAMKLLEGFVKLNSCATVRTKLENLLAEYNNHIEIMRTGALISTPDLKTRHAFINSQPQCRLAEIIRELESSLAPYQARASSEVSVIQSRRTTFDSFRTATTGGITYLTALSSQSLEHLGSSPINVKNSFRALLRRGIPARILQVNQTDQRPRPPISQLLVSRPQMISEDDDSLLQEIVGQTQYKKEAGSEIDVEDSFEELDWCGRGMHVDFEDTATIPLEHLAPAGRTRLAVVDIVRCRRIKLARKIIRLPRTKKVTAEILQEVLALHHLSHAHVVRLVGTYIHKRLFATLMYPAAEMNLEEYLEELQPDSSNSHLSKGVNTTMFRKFEHNSDVHSAQDTLSEGSICLMSGLRYLHESGVIHSDIKPANIILKNMSFGEASSPRIWYKMYFCDFGISRILDPEGETQTEEEILKTPRYASPEVMLAGRHGRASDVFSFGYVLAEMATVYSGLFIKDFRNYIHFNASTDLAEYDTRGLRDLTPEEIEDASAPFGCYYKQYRPKQIKNWFSECSDMKIPNALIYHMLSEDSKKRPRLPTSLSHLASRMVCRHDRDGAQPFEIENEAPEIGDPLRAI